MIHGKHKAANCVACVDNNGEVGHTAESGTRGFSLSEIIIRNAYIFIFQSLAPTPTLDRDSHDLFGVGVTSYDVNSGVVNGGALKPVFRKPIKYDCLTEATSDLRMPRAFADSHRFFFTEQEGSREVDALSRRSGAPTRYMDSISFKVLPSLFFHAIRPFA